MAQRSFGIFLFYERSLQFFQKLGALNQRVRLGRDNKPY
jgi:hypothetical protein